MRTPRMRRLSLFLVVGALAAGLSACSSGSGSTTPASSSGTSSAPELTSITVGVLSVTDFVTVQIAQDEGIFQQEGFKNVNVVRLESSATDDIQLLSHTLDFASENYVSMFTQEKNDPSLNLRIVADLAQGTPDLFVMMVPKGSKITSLAQLKGQNVGCPSKSISYCQMALSLLLKPYGISLSDLKIVATPFATVPTALHAGTVAAAYETEPFITILEAQGDRILQDMNEGPLVSAPESCFGVLASFLQKYPKTVAAFQRAMAKANGIADADPALVRKELPKFVTTLKSSLASVITLPTWNTTLSLARMQRVASIMEELNYLPKNFDVSAMYVPPPAGS
jgi:NitT/TauT family transport system substrate-binding protein